MRSLLAVALVGTLGFLGGCGGGTPAGVAVTIALNPTSASIHAGQTVNIVATVSNDSSTKGVTWTLSGVGTLTSITATSATYNAPATVTSNSVATVTATSAASSGVSASLQITVLPAGVAINVQPISVDGGPVAGSIYPNGAFTSVTICVPGTPTCQTIDGILVDTGSFGLRVLASQITISLPVLTDSTGTNELNDCVKFADLSFLWGTVAQADIIMAGEVAGQSTTSLTTLQSIANPTSYSIPVNCSNGGNNEDTQAALGANGILGVGPAAVDCGFSCDPASGGSPPEPAYYLCGTASGCVPSFVPCGNACGGTLPNEQLTNPVFNFPVDNNGVILELPSVAGVAATVDGNMVFGIGTQPNNALGAAKVFTMDSSFNFTTTLTGQAPVPGFIDSGSNGLFFLDTATTGLPTCSDPFWYCPANTTPLSATQLGTNNASNLVNFSVDNFDTVTSGNPGDAAFGNLAGPFPGSFDWGLPFFYGRSVFTAIDGTNVGTPGPFWAY